MKNFITIFILASIGAFSSCMDYSLDDLGPTTDAKDMNAMVAPLRFNWTTSQSVSVSFKGTVTSNSIQSTLSISGSKSSYYKALHSNSKNQEIKLTIPSNETSFTVKFNGSVQTVSIVGGKAVIDFSKFASQQKTTSRQRIVEDALGDQDGDGVIDIDDDYPTDANRAYNNNFPSINNQGTLAFEDNWPTKADYDFNDVVVDYNINTVTNAQNQVVEVIGTFTLKASGASYNNGFGFQLDNISPSKITTVTGSHLSSQYISLDSKGLENNQTFANCIVFDDFYSIMPRQVGKVGVNTEKGISRVTPQTITTTITFIDNGVVPSGGAVLLSDLPFSVYNFYIIANRNRGVEIHLPDRVPTSLANRGLFGQQDDDSAGSSRFYRTQNNLPWAINVIQGFDYPIERVPIDEAYLHLIRWAETSGAEFSDWYSNGVGYRVSSNLY
ncbi:MAG: LruC domain-containing protein [Bacteroidales bacterium]